MRKTGSIIGNSRGKLMEEKIREIMVDILEVSNDQIHSNTTMDSVDTWDSLRHMEMVFAFESEFGVEFEPDELAELTGFKEICSLISTKREQ